MPAGMKQEFHHNTPEQVLGYLAAALLVVDDLDPPADLREACFNHAVSLTAAKQIMVEQVHGLPPNMVVPRGL